MEDERQIEQEDLEKLFTVVCDFYDEWLKEARTDRIIGALSEMYAKAIGEKITHPACACFTGFCAGMNKAFEFQEYKKNHGNNLEGK